MIQSIGQLWSADDVFWGRGSQAGRLLGVPSRAKKHTPIDFRAQVGIYVLYADFNLVYVGQTGVGESQRLLHRLKQHRDGYMKGRWNRFSWFGVLWVKGNLELSAGTKTFHPPLAQVLNHLEAILIDTAEPALNSQGGRFGNSVQWYRQVRDERLGPSLAKMVSDLWHRNEDG
jgi:hypothetical protein